MIHQVRVRPAGKVRHLLFTAEMYTSFRGSSAQPSLEMLSVNLVATESHPLPSVMVEGYFQGQHNSLCLQGVAEASLLERSTALPVLEML